MFGEHYVAVIKRHFIYLCCFITNITALEDEVRNLDDVTYELRGRVNTTASHNIEEIKPEVVSWLRDSNIIKEEANRILNEVPTVGGCLRVATRYYLSRRAKMTIEAMTMHRERGKFLGEDLSLPAAPAPFPLGTTYEFYGRKQIEQDIMRTLSVNKEKILGICGMGGIGKTTMVKKIMNKLLEEGVFQEVVIVAVSQRVDEVKIQLDIGGALGLGYLEIETPQSRAQKLHDRLTSSTKRTLLVLDDVWESLHLNELGLIPCEGDSQRCTILITSRNSDALKEMGVEKIYNIDLLSEEDAWFLFRNAVGTCVDDIRLQSIAKRIVETCRGLPIALVTIGGTLRDKTSIQVWKDALRKLRDPNPPDFIPDIYMPMKMSYNALESELAKLVFLLCGLFPENSDIRLEYLTYFCMGLCIFEESIFNMDEARDRMTILIKKLKRQSLLLDGEEEDCVRMHDVVRDACIFIAKQEGYIDGQDCTWMSSCSRWTEPGLGFPNLKLLYLISDSVEGGEFKMDDTFFQGMRDLNVLSIESYSWTSLPRTTQLLINIRTLLLVSCPNLETISAVGDLVNLEILICRGCGSIEELPMEIKRLFRLKLLELSECPKLQSIGPGVISSAGLEELKMLGSFNQWYSEEGRERQNNAGLRELENLANLKCLEIEIEDPALALEMMHLSSKLERFEIRIPAGFHIFWRMYDRKMRLHWEGETCLGHWIEMEILRDVEWLYLTGDGTYKLGFQKIKNLKRLELGECETIKSIGTTSMDDGGNADTMFLFIEYLKLFSLPRLEAICDCPISSNSFQYLKQIILEDLPALEQLWKNSTLHRNNYVPPFTHLSSIEIKRCPRLCNLWQVAVEGWECMRQLEILHIEECEMIEQVFSWDEENRINVGMTLAFPNLKLLSLKSLPKVKNLCRGIESFKFPQLHQMQVKDCPLLENVVPINLFPKDDKRKEEPWKIYSIKHNVEYLSVEGDVHTNVNLRLVQNTQCLSLGESWTGMKSANMKTVDSSFTLLKALRLVKLTELEEVWDIDDSRIHSNSFKNLNELRLEFLPALEHLWRSSNSRSHINVSIFSHLSSIYIYGCHGLRSLFALPGTTTGPPCTFQLEKLVIESCDMLEQVFSWNEGESHKSFHIPNLKVLILDSLPRLTTLCRGTENFEFHMLDRFRISRCPLLEGHVSSYSHDDDSAHLFCKPHQEKTELKVQGNISVGKEIEECVEYMSFEGDGSRISDVHQVARSMRCMTFRGCSMNMATIATVFPLLEVMWLVDITDLEEICDIDGMKHLKELRLKLLPALKHLRQFDTTPSQINVVVSIFNQLSCIYIYGCHQLCNLFSLTAMTTSSGSCLPLLERLVVESCGMMEQVFLWNEESEKQTISIDNPQLFPKLKVLILDSLPRLTTICQGTKSLEFPLLAQMKISRCPLLENLVSTGGWSSENHDNHQLHKLANAGKRFFTQLQKRMEESENHDDQSHKLAIAGKSCISHLQILSIEECGMMEHVFVHKNQRNVDIKRLVFSELKSLSLKSLPKLSSLSKEIKSFEFPLLDHIQIKDCPKLESIDTISLFNKPDKVEMELWKNQPFKTSEYLSLEEDAKRNLDFRVAAQNMRCLSFRECKRGAKLVNMTTMDDLFPRLEVLRLLKLTELQEIWDIDDDGSIPNTTCFKNLKELRLEFLPALNRLWKSTNKLSVVSIFSQLSSIYIYGCHSLRNLFALPPGSTTTGSHTFQLENLVIASCDLMEQVFLCTEGENQISLHFPKLKVLILDSLPKLTSLSKGTKVSTGASILSKGLRISISRCPLLQEIYDTPYQDDRAGDDDSLHLFCKPYPYNKEKMELRVHGNISVGNKIEECVEYMSFEGDGSRISDVGQVAQSMRCLILTECSMNMATIATVFPHLEVMWLVEITDLEEICDIDGMKHLKELRLKSLPALKHLRQFHTTPSQINVVSIFSQLSCIYIYGCHKLCNLFSLTAMTTSSGSCLPLLERLVVESCGMMEQVFLWNDEERNIDITPVFPKLKFLSLISLPKLTSFCKGNESLEFPLLARVRITRCPLLVLGNFISNEESPNDQDDTVHSIRKPDKKKAERWISELHKNVTYLSVEEDVDRNLDLQQLLNTRQLRSNSKECSRGVKSVNLAAIAPVFPLLEVLQLVKLAEVEKMEFDGTITMTSNSLQNLRELRLQSLQALKHLWKSSSSPSQMNVALIFNQLSTIYIYGCNGLSNLFSLSMTARGSCLSQLEKLEIESCEMMEQVFLWNEESGKPRSNIHVGEFPKLNCLRLSFLPRLTDFSRGIKRIECPLLTKVKIVNCPKLRSSVHLNGKHSLIFNSSKSVQHQRAKDTNSAMQLSRPGKEKGKRRLEDSSNEIKECDTEKWRKRRKTQVKLFGTPKSQL